MNLKSSVLASLAIFTAVLASDTFARQGATDPIPGTSKGTVNSGGNSGGGGGGNSNKNKSTTPAPVVLPPAPPPATFTPVVLTFDSVNPINGVTPVCSGDYHIDPYYPTLYLLTVSVDLTSVNSPDGTPYYVNVSGTSGTLYPFTSNVISTTGGTGLCTYSVYVTPGTTITQISITDDAGRTVASGH